MLHTRLRPHCKDFLEKIAKLYELHVFTFGSRLYAHTIAGQSRTGRGVGQKETFFRTRSCRGKVVWDHR